MDYVELEDHVEDLISAIYSDGSRIVTVNALDAQLDSVKQKTVFILKPENGFIMFKQQLPFTWHALDMKPEWEVSAD